MFNYFVEENSTCQTNSSAIFGKDVEIWPTAKQFNLNIMLALGWHPNIQLMISSLSSFFKSTLSSVLPVKKVVAVSRSVVEETREPCAEYKKTK